MKQRLVGAIVLVALAVIFLPMLLDGSGQSGPHEIAIEIPAEPQPPANRLEPSRDLAVAAPEPSAQAPSDQVPVLGPDTSGGESDAQRSGAGDGAASARAAGEGAGGAASAGGAETPDRPASANATETENDADSETDAEVKAESASGPSAWVVQVGSFARETNALVLRDRLRAADFDAFAERADSGGQTVWRVRIGPVATEAEAQQLGERLQQERDGPALVMTHP